MKLWAGRFQKETDTLVNDFNSSIGFDARLYKQDIQGSIAHAAMLGRQGIIEEHEAEKIINGLKTILSEIEGDGVEFSLDNEDIHMNIEAMLTQRIGDADIVLTNKTPISKATMDKCPNVKMIAVLATGYNVVDIACAKEKGIPVIFTEVNGSDATAQAIHRETGCAVAQLTMVMDGPDDQLVNYYNALLANAKAVIDGFAGEELVK